MNARSKTRHARQRQQQRAIPPIVEQWLDEFGERQYSGRGAVLEYFSSRSLRRMETHLGRHFLAENRKYLRAYRIVDSRGDTTITIGWLRNRVRNS